MHGMGLGMKRKPSVPAEYLALLRDYRREEKIEREQNTAKASQNNDSDSDIDFEDVKLDNEDTGPHNDKIDSDTKTGNSSPQAEAYIDSDEENEMNNVSLDPDDRDNITVSIDSSQASHLTRGRTKKKGMSKKERLFYHKLYLMAWMIYSKQRNIWTNHPLILERLRLFLPEDIKAELQPPAHLTTFLKSKQFVNGLIHAMAAWNENFDVIPTENEGAPSPRNFEEFNDQITNMQGSKATLGLGFVALMRSIGLESRLVCSLQPPDNLNTTPSRTVDPFSSPSPIFWAEVWDSFANKWAAVDPLTSTFRLPNRTKVKLKLEPSLSDPANEMRYCISWNEQNKARDVTRRYASNYNARARKKRISYVDEDSIEWLNRLYAHFANYRTLGKRDKEEILELSKYPRLEGIPQRAQDFIGHPEYALPDQLHYNEVLREGAMHSGVLTLKNQKKPIYIYRRSDVLVCRTAQTWYRNYGRVLKPLEQPVTHRSQTNRLTGESEETGMYTFDQTEPYVPPDVSVDGEIPKSQYRTIDLFCSNMLPKGAVHIIDKRAAKAAKFLRVDYANAVVKIEYGKRGAQSIYSGIVVARQFAEAVVLVLKGFRQLERQEAQEAENFRIISLWRKFIIGIQIWERVETMNPQRGAISPDDDGDDDDYDDDYEESNDGEGPSGRTPQQKENTAHLSTGASSSNLDSEDSFGDKDIDEIDL